MAILIHKLKTLNPKKALSAVFLAGFTVLLLASPFAKATGPEFNIFPISYTGGVNMDLPLLDAKNIPRGETYSTSQTDHDAGIQASGGEIIQFSIYYHNGAPDADENVAINTIIRAFSNPTLSIPALEHTISASVGAQNAATVSSSSKGGDMNVHIQGGQLSSLSLVPGSVVLYRDQGFNPQIITLPDTVFTSGVNIGNIRGCFQYHGFVNFRLQVSTVLVGDLQLKKYVKNITQGGTVFNDIEVNANPSDILEYQIVVSALNNPVPNVFVKDALAPKLTLSGLPLLDGVPIDSSAFFSNAGVNIGTVTPGINRVISFNAVVAPVSQFTVGTHNLPNTATAFNDQKSHQDGANVRVTIQPQVITCNFTWDPPLVSDGSQRGLRHPGEQFNVQQQVTGLSPYQNFNIVFQHIAGTPVFKVPVSADFTGVYNAKNTSIIPSSYTAGDYSSFIEINNAFVATCRGMRIELPVVQNIDLDKTVSVSGFADQIDAEPGQRVTFRLLINPLASNTTLQNVTLRDTLPAKLTFVSGTFNVNGVYQSEGNFFSTGINLGTLNPGSQIVVTFQADVASAANFSVGIPEFLVNNSTVTASGGLIDSDSATVRVCKQAPTKQPGSPGPRPN